jgi:hypothetical protein
MSEPNGFELSMGEGHSELRVPSTEGPPVWTLGALAHAAWQLEPPAPTRRRRSCARGGPPRRLALRTRGARPGRA